MIVVCIARVTTASTDAQARAVAENLTLGASASRHIADDEVQGRDHLCHYVRQRMQSAPPETLFRVRYAVAEVTDEGHIGHFFERGSASEFVVAYP